MAHRGTLLVVLLQHVIQQGARIDVALVRLQQTEQVQQQIGSHAMIHHRFGVEQLQVGG
jgi:hypothetical protein